MSLRIPRPITLTKLVNILSEYYKVTKRPLRYFDVKKRGDLTDSEIKKVKERFEELVKREICVKKDPGNPICYRKSSTDVKAPKKQESSYKKDYSEIYRDPCSSAEMKQLEVEGKTLQGLIQKEFKINIPLGVCKISIETGINPIVLKEIYNRAVGAYATSGSRTGMTAEQWGYGRIYSFIMCYKHNKNGKYNSRRFYQNNTDSDLRPLI